MTTPTPETLASFDAVTVSYNGTPVVDDVSFDVGRGEWFGVLGPNGAGKSTLLRTAVGGTITSGGVAIAGSGVHEVQGRSRAHLVAYVPQRPVFPVGMSVFDYALLGRTPHMGPLVAESRSDVGIVWEVLASLALTAFAERDVASLSGGETQRVSMARVLAQRAPVLVLDEATAALDIASQHDVLELVDRIRLDTGMAIVSAMHDLTAAAQFCDRVALIDRGRLRGVGSPKEVLRQDLLREVFEPTVRVIDIEGSQVIVSMRDKERR
ncbi:MAG: ABC transporter ATP-binding protein [Acidimicrobiia bacterium]